MDKICKNPDPLFDMRQWYASQGMPDYDNADPIFCSHPAPNATLKWCDRSTGSWFSTRD